MPYNSLDSFLDPTHRLPRRAGWGELRVTPSRYGYLAPIQYHFVMIAYSLVSNILGLITILISGHMNFCNHLIRHSFSLDSSSSLSY